MMTALLKLSGLIDALNRFIGRWVIWLVLGSTVVSALNAVVRKAFNISSNAFLELQWYLFAASFLSTPFFIAGGLKIVYDLLLYRSFSAVKPPEEKKSA